MVRRALSITGENQISIFYIPTGTINPLDEGAAVDSWELIELAEKDNEEESETENEAQEFPNAEEEDLEGDDEFEDDEEEDEDENDDEEEIEEAEPEVAFTYGQLFVVRGKRD